jgi:hypothetical protein
MEELPVTNKARKAASKGKKLRRKMLGSVRPLKAPLKEPSPSGPVPIPYPNA